ncbi:MAG: glycosyltransferase family 2 protein [Deltaproteobacteria bacterium]|nr:glycosyltransferase family 2 protein [Deltaproteobacteria bacterium]
MSSIAVTVVMPALNEAGNLAGAVANVLDSFRHRQINGELIIVDDGSSDGTGAMADRYTCVYDNVRVLHHENPQGIGASFWAGVSASAGEVVVMIPGDGENDAEEILRYFPLMEEVDIVIPFVYNSTMARSLGRRFLSIVFREIIKAGFGLSLNYMNGTVMYRRTVFEGIELKNEGFFYQSELLIKTISRGYLYAEVPCALRQRGSGDSRATTWKSLKRVASGYIQTFSDIHFGTKRSGIAKGTATARRSGDLQKWNG